MLIKRRDVYVFALALILAVSAYAFIALARSQSVAERVMEVRVDGEYRLSEELGEARSVTIEQPDGSVNILRITERGFYMEYSSCKNQLCVRQGEVTLDNYKRRSLGAHILCLPNRVDAYLVLSSGDEGAPDA